MELEHIKLQYDRLKRHYNRALNEKDIISFLDFSHSLRIWVDLKFNIDQINLIQDISDDQLAIAEIFVCHDKNNLHDLPIDLKDLIIAAPTLLNKFLIAESVNGDFGTHTDKQVIIGFFPKENNLRYVEKDGFTYLVADAIISKIYADWAYDIFTQDNERSVSMEITILETKEEDGKNYIKSFVFNAVTILGKKVLPACEGANAKIVKFSEQSVIDECGKFYTSHFGKYDGLDFKVPKAVKKNAQEGLDLRKEYGRGGTSVGLSTARYLVKNETASPEKVRHIAKYFPRHQYDNLDDKTSNGYIAWNLWGGDAGRKWSNSLVEAMNKKDEEKLSYFSNQNNNGLSGDSVNHKTENSVKEVIDKMSIRKEEFATKFSISVNQIFEMARETLSQIKYKREDEYECEKYWCTDFDDMFLYCYDYENGGKCAVPFTVSDGKMVADFENVKKAKLMSIWVTEGTEKFEETKEDDEAYMSVVEEKQKMSSNANVDAVAMQELNEKAAETNKELAEENTSLKEAMSEMTEKMSKAEEEKEVYSKENAELKEFKVGIEKQNKDFAVDSTLNDVVGILPEDDIDTFRKSAENFSLETIDVWKNEVKAKAFTFAKGKDTKADFIKVGFPTSTKPIKSGLWD